MKSIDSRTMQQRLYDILKMNIKLARTNNKSSSITSDTYNSFEETARNIDEYDQQEYEKEVSKLFNTTITLAEEKERLEKLVDVVSKRIEERSKLLKEYEEITSKTLSGLNSIVEELELDSYRQRLANIKEYLENKKNIENIEVELDDLNSELLDSQEQKRRFEENNYELEDALFEKFKDILSGSEDTADIIDTIDVEFELEKLVPQLDESKKTLDTFEKAFYNLAKSGISDAKEEEYSTYVADAKEAYYQLKEKEILLKLYKLICSTENEYIKLYNKRDEIEKILSYRMDLRRELNITKPDLLLDFYKIIDEQETQMRLEKNNIDKINKIIDKITFKENKLESYKEANQKSGIISVLQEYGIIEVSKEEPKVEEEANIVPVIEDIKELPPVSFGDLGVMEEIKEPEVTVKEEKYIPNAIKTVEGVPENINVSFVRNKANTVMRRVGKALGIETPKPELTKTSKPLDKKEAVNLTPVLEKTETGPLVSPVMVEEIIPNNVSPSPANIDLPKPEVDSNLKLPKMESVFTEPVLELPKEDIFTSNTNNNQKSEEVSTSVQVQTKPSQVVPFPTPVLESPKIEPQKPVSVSNSGLFWPEAKPNIENSSVEKKDFFPQPSITNNSDFNPQELNSNNRLDMPNIPQGSVNLGPGPGQVVNPAIKIRKAA